MANPFVHIELSTVGVGAAKKFYQSVFAWKLRDLPGMGYTVIDAGTGTGGGMQEQPMPEAPNLWLPYVEVADVKQTMAKAIAAGATAVLPFQDIGEMGSIGIFLDPQGAALGVWAPPPKRKASAKKPAANKAAKKPVAKKPVANKATKKPVAKKPVAKKPVANKATKKPVAKKLSKKR